MLKTKPIPVGIKQGLQAHLIARQAPLIAQQVLLTAQQAHHTALCRPHQRAQGIALLEAPLSQMTSPKGTRRTHVSHQQYQTAFVDCWQTEEAQGLEI